jgi:iron complex transport system permease protein
LKRLPVVTAFAVAGVLLLGVLALSLILGPARLSAAEVAGALRGAGDPVHRAIVFDARLARALLAALCGAALAGSGVVFQGLFRNPLADPYIVGTSGGAGLAAVLTLVLGVASLSTSSAAAFAGGLTAAALAWRLGRHRGAAHSQSLLLSGFAVGSFCGAAMALSLLASGRSWDDVLRWLFGSCAQPDAWRRLAVAAPLVALALASVAPRLRELNVLLSGEESAAHLGVDVDRARAWLLGAGAVLASASVAAVGIVGFVGLIVPHIARVLVGPDHRRLLPVSILFGAALLAAADLIARCARPPMELPVGAVTSMFGAPFFLWLLRKKACGAERS